MWNSHASDYFSISNGVKQGGVISPIIFNLYNISILLKQSSICCHINGMYMVALGYAYYITLQGDAVNSQECVKLIDTLLSWKNSVRHFGIFLL